MTQPALITPAETPAATPIEVPVAVPIGTIGTPGGPPPEPQTEPRTGNLTGNNAAAVRLTEAQRRYLERGLTEAGGKLPLFDRDGREVSHKTVEACIAHGWAERWITNPIKPDWPVCRLTELGRQALGHEARG